MDPPRQLRCFGTTQSPSRSRGVALVGEPPVTGVLVLRQEAHSSLIENIAVHPDEQGKVIGAAPALMDFSEQEAARCDVCGADHPLHQRGDGRESLVPRPPGFYGGGPSRAIDGPSWRSVWVSPFKS